MNNPLEKNLYKQILKIMRIQNFQIMSKNTKTQRSRMQTQ